MDLDRYLRERKLTSLEFAELAGISGKAVVHNYRTGKRFPSVENLRRIRDATKGLVTANDFVEAYVGAVEKPLSEPPKRRGQPSKKAQTLAVRPHARLAERLTNMPTAET